MQLKAKQEFSTVEIEYLFEKHSFECIITF